MDDDAWRRHMHATDSHITARRLVSSMSSVERGPRFMLHMDLNDRLRALVHARDLDVKRTHKSGMNEGVRTLTPFFVWLEIY